MKKYFVIFSIFALCACAKELAPEKEDVSSPYSETLTARIVNTKVNISDTGKFSWSEGDKIAVHRSVNGYETASLSLDGVFGVHLSEGETRDGYAIYPASVADENASDASNLAVVLPNAYDISKAGMGDYSPLPMVAVNDPASEDVLFHHLGGVFRLELTKLPYETQKIAVNFGKRITGTFAVEGLDTDTPFISLPDEEGEDVVYSLRSYITSSTDKIIINVPVPVGTYHSLSYKIYDRYGNMMGENTEEMSITVERADGYDVLQDLTIDVSRIPLCLKMGELGEIKIKNPLLLTMEFSFDNLDWEAFNVPEKAFVLKRGGCLYLRGNNSRYSTDGRSQNSTTISSKATCYVYGNVMSLITPDPDDFSQLKTLTERYAFSRLFYDDNYGGSGIINHPTMDLILPATTLSPYCYSSMFSYSKINRIYLPAMELAEYCYSEMFSGLQLQYAMDTLPATTLAPSCYYAMFRSSRIESAPTIVADSLAQSSCSQMFSSCRNLVNPPKILATTLTDNCCSSMFSGCTSLVTAPELPATVFKGWFCYSSMFSGCTSLVNAPELPATTLSWRCYQYMFDGCTSLVNAPALPATSLTTNPYTETQNEGCYQYMFKGCTSLVNAPELPATDISSYCYEYMFQDCSSLVTAPELPATHLTPYCYSYMFTGCTSLVNAPALTSDDLNSNCYQYMFEGCTSLVNAPALPAIKVDFSCYQGMFSGCTSLVNAPALPATVLMNDSEDPSENVNGYYCYSEMFKGCTSLVNAPALPATVLIDRCYSEMFSGCTSLVNAPDLPALILRSECYAGMFNGCSSLNYVKAMFTSGYEDRYTTVDIPSAVDGWLTGVAASGSFVMNEAATYAPSDIGVPSGWTVTTATE